MWNVGTGNELSHFAGQDLGRFWHSAFSPDGSNIAVGSLDFSTAYVFDVRSGILLQAYRGHSDAVERAIYSRDGSRLLTSSVDHTARLWDTTTTIELRRFVHGDAVRQSAFPASGDDVFTASADGTVRRWSGNQA